MRGFKIRVIPPPPHKLLYKDYYNLSDTISLYVFSDMKLKFLSETMEIIPFKSFEIFKDIRQDLNHLYGKYHANYVWGMYTTTQLQNYS